MRNSLLLLPLAVAAAAEPNGQFSNPVLGYVFEASSKSVRPLAGVVGAAALEAAVPSASKLEFAFIAPNQKRLFALTKDVAFLWDLAGAGTAELAGAPADIQTGAWSPDSSTFAAFSPTLKAIQVWSSADLKYSLPADAVSGIFVADRGESVLFWNDSGLFQGVPDGIVQQLRSEAVVAAAYTGGSAEWVAITKSYLLRPGVDPEPLTVSNAQAIVYSSKGLIVAGENVVAVNGATVRCGCAITGVDRLAGADVFRLSGTDAPAIAVLDIGDSEAQITYIPAEGARQ